MKIIKKIALGLLYIGLGLICMALIMLGTVVIGTPILWGADKIAEIARANSDITQVISLIILLIIAAFLIGFMIYSLYNLGKIICELVQEKIEGRKIKKHV